MFSLLSGRIRALLPDNRKHSQHCSGRFYIQNNEGIHRSSRDAQQKNKSVINRIFFTFRDTPLPCHAPRCSLKLFFQFKIFVCFSVTIPGRMNIPESTIGRLGCKRWRHVSDECFDIRFSFFVCLVCFCVLLFSLSFSPQ